MRTPLTMGFHAVAEAVAKLQDSCVAMGGHIRCLQTARHPTMCAAHLLVWVGRCLQRSTLPGTGPCCRCCCPPCWTAPHRHADLICWFSCLKPYACLQLARFSGLQSWNFTHMGLGLGLIGSEVHIVVTGPLALYIDKMMAVTLRAVPGAAHGAVASVPIGSS